MEYYRALNEQEELAKHPPVKVVLKNSENNKQSVLFVHPDYFDEIYLGELIHVMRKIGIEAEILF